MADRAGSTQSPEPAVTLPSTASLPNITPPPEIQQISDESRLQGLPPLDYLLAKYAQLVEKSGEAIPETTDPALKIMLQLEVILRNGSDPAALSQLRQTVEALPADYRFKPYLLLIYAVKAAQAKAISQTALSSLLEQALKLGESNADLQYLGYKLYLQLGNEAKAFDLLMRSYHLLAKLPPEGQLYSLDNWQAEVRELAPLLPPDLLLEVAAFFSSKAAQAAGAQAYDTAVTYLASAIKLIEIIDTGQDKSLALLTGHLHMQISELCLAKDEIYEAYNELSIAAQAYEAAPADDPIAQLTLAEIYLKFLLINRQQPARETYLIYGSQKCRYKALAVLAAVESQTGDQPALLGKLAELYLAAGQLAKTIELYKRLTQLEPNNPAAWLKLGDFLLGQGEIEPAFSAYKQGLQAALANKDLSSLSDAYLRFSLLKTNAQKQLVDLQTGQPTPLQELLNFVTQSLMLCLNPLGTLPRLISGALGSQKQFDEAELQLIIKESADLEGSCLAHLNQIAIENNDLNIYFNLYAQITGRTVVFAQLLAEMAATITKPEKISAYRQLSEQVRQQALGMIEIVSSGPFAQHIDDEFARALASQDPALLTNSTREIYSALMAFYQLLSMADLPTEIKSPLAAETDELFPRLRQLLKRANELAQERKEPALALQFAQLASELALHLPPNLKSQKRQLFDQAGELLQSSITLAKDNQDENTLFTIAAGLYATPQYSALAVTALTDLAGNDLKRLQALSLFLLDLWTKGEQESSLTSQEIRQALGEKLKELYGLMLENKAASREEKVNCCRQLWIIGQLDEAYLGYMRLAMEEKGNKDWLGPFYYELGLMGFARGKPEKGLEWLEKALKEGRFSSAQKAVLAAQLELLRQQKSPADFPVTSDILPAYRLWAASLLYQIWGGTSEQAINDLLFSEGLKPVETITAIEIVGNQRTASEIYLQELQFAGITVGRPLDTSLAEVRAKLESASRRLGTFKITDVHLINGRLIVLVEEKSNWDIRIDGGAAGHGFDGSTTFGYKNLFGRGVRAGASFNFAYQKDLAGIKSFKYFGGRLYYFDPTLFVVGKDRPVSGGATLEHKTRFNPRFNSIEVMTGGELSLGIQITRDSTLTLSPRFYHVKETRFGGTYYEGGVRLTYAMDKRDNPLFPTNGFYFSASVEPGFYQTGNGGEFYFNSPLDFRYYQPLGLGFVLALRAAAGFGYNLMGGSQYSLGGGMMNPYVRGASGPAGGGNIMLSLSGELRAPLIDVNKLADVAEDYPIKIQPYVLVDGGLIPGSRGQYGVGGGVRILLPVIGLINIGYSYPGGFFLWFGDSGWN